jgi:hypothetical protein
MCTEQSHVCVLNSRMYVMCIVQSHVCVLNSRMYVFCSVACMCTEQSHVCDVYCTVACMWCVLYSRMYVYYTVGCMCTVQYRCVTYSALQYAQYQRTSALLTWRYALIKTSSHCNVRQAVLYGGKKEKDFLAAALESAVPDFTARSAPYLRLFIFWTVSSCRRHLAFLSLLSFPSLRFSTFHAHTHMHIHTPSSNWFPFCNRLIDASLLWSLPSPLLSSASLPSSLFLVFLTFFITSPFDSLVLDGT